MPGHTQDLVILGVTKNGFPVVTSEEALKANGVDPGNPDAIRGAFRNAALRCGNPIGPDRIQAALAHAKGHRHNTGVLERAEKILKNHGHLPA